jgi:plastocyanin
MISPGCSFENRGNLSKLNQKKINQGGMMKINKVTVFSTAMILAVLVLAACSSGGSGGGTSITVTTTEFAFTPANITVPAGAAVNLTLKNTGSVEHTWVILKQGVDVTSATGLDPASIVFSSKVEAGQTANFTFTAPATAGDYQIICDLPGHLEGGMKGTLTVK